MPEPRRTYSAGNHERGELVVTPETDGTFRVEVSEPCARFDPDGVIVLDRSEARALWFWLGEELFGHGEHRDPRAEPCVALFTCGCSATVISTELAAHVDVARAVGRECELCGAKVVRYDLLDFPPPASMLLTKVTISR